MESLFERQPVSVESATLRKVDSDSLKLSVPTQRAELPILEKVAKQSALVAAAEVESAETETAEQVAASSKDESSSDEIPTATERNLEDNAVRSMGMSGDENDRGDDFLPPTSD